MHPHIPPLGKTPVHHLIAYLPAATPGAQEGAIHTRNRATMANSRFEYVRQFERENFLLPDTYVVIRVDGKGFHQFSATYSFEKPNDIRALHVMNRAARALMAAFPDVQMAYGDSDEYSFLLRKKCVLFERREMKLVSTFAASMLAHYMHEWQKEFPEKPLDAARLPTFDARAVVYPNEAVVRDYFSWRQADCHINNLYNTTFWTLVEKGGLTPQEAENRLIGTVSSDKNEILFLDFGINYNNEPAVFRKGTVLVRERARAPEGADLSARQQQRVQKLRRKAEIKEHSVDIIGDAFWHERPWILE